MLPADQSAAHGENVQSVSAPAPMKKKCNVFGTIATVFAISGILAWPFFFIFAELRASIDYPTSEYTGVKFVLIFIPVNSTSAEYDVYDNATQGCAAVAFGGPVAAILAGCIGLIAFGKTYRKRWAYVGLALALLPFVLAFVVAAIRGVTFF